MKYLHLTFAVALVLIAGCNSASLRTSIFENGLASWYGPGFYGKKTASGERFKKNDMTAAHKTLPFGTMVRVKSLSTGKEISVRINDRGPFKKGRVIDLSYAAAKQLGILQKGMDKVELVVEEPRQAKLAAGSSKLRKN
ncbi:MAG: septal ring lytic transglycosylase RlpA family protein [Bdellovibrionia bacterium]